MIALDSSGWIEYFRDGPNAEAFAALVERPEEIVVPTACLYEVYKHLRTRYPDDSAFLAIAWMRKGIVAPLTTEIALDAAVLSTEHKLPMADSIILATARRYGAVLWTQDADFEGMEGVEYRRYIP